jgi:pimeloyl-ACP methyl ester carboxylesterase
LGYDRSGTLRDKYLRAEANRSAHARWFKHVGAPRPCLVLIHGYMAGNYLIEERIWPVKRLFNSGLDVVVSVLPLHGLRRAQDRGYRPPAFPSSDPRFTIEGVRQLVFDQRALFAYLRAGRVSELGVMGMSLGGYAAALLATLESDLRLGVLFVPMASIEDSALRHGHMRGTPAEQAEQRALLERAHLPVSPFARASRVPSERMVVVAGEADLVTGVEPARALAQHFGAQLSLFHGGHLLHAGREEAFRPVWQLLGEFAATGLV